MAKKSAKRDKAPKPVSPEPDGEEERLTDLDHSEELDRMVDRLRGLETAIEGLNLEAGCPADFILNGVYQLIEDVCDKMQACADAFCADRQHRMAEEGCEQAVRVLGEEAVKMVEERRLRLEEEHQ
jgi:hypothetical protein